MHVCLHTFRCSLPSGGLVCTSDVRTLLTVEAASASLWLPKGHSSPPGLVHKPSGSCPLRVVPSHVPGSHTAGRVCKRVCENGMLKRQSLPGITKTAKVKWPSGFWNEKPKQAHLASFFKTWNHTDGVHFSRPVQSAAKDTATGRAHQAGFCMHAARIFWSPCYGDKMNGFLSSWQNTLGVSSKGAALNLYIKLI